MAIAAARERLRLFAQANPAPASVTTCPLISAESLSTAAQAVDADIVVDVDPWSASTTVNPELRPVTTPAGEVGGLPVVTCAGDRPADDSLTRPTVLAIRLDGGVSFGDVVRAYGLDGALRITPAGLGGTMAGTCLTTPSTGSCVVLWQSEDLVVGTSLTGPPAAVNTATSGALLTAIVPTVINSLAVVRGAVPPCTAGQLATTGITLIEDPDCQGGWALGQSVPCPTDPNAPCTSRQAFHLEEAGWVSDGAVTADCAEHLTTLGMTGDTAKHFVAPCDPSAVALSGGRIRPGDSGVRVRALQIALLNQGYVLPIDSQYGPLTEAAVIDFQEARGLNTVGSAGPQTRAALGI